MNGICKGRGYRQCCHRYRAYRVGRAEKHLDNYIVINAGIHTRARRHLRHQRTVDHYRTIRGRSCYQFSAIAIMVEEYSICEARRQAMQYDLTIACTTVRRVDDIVRSNVWFTRHYYIRPGRYGNIA